MGLGEAFYRPPAGTVRTERDQIPGRVEYVDVAVVRTKFSRRNAHDDGVAHLDALVCRDR